MNADVQRFLSADVPGQAGSSTGCEGSVGQGLEEVFSADLHSWARARPDVALEHYAYGVGGKGSGPSAFEVQRAGIQG